MSTSKSLRVPLLAVGLLCLSPIILTGCGGSSGSPNVAGTDIPVYATANASEVVSFGLSVSAVSDANEPLAVGDAVLATSETDEPDGSV